MNSDGVFFLWCYITRQPVNLPMVLALQLRRRGGRPQSTSPILGTHLITALANSYGIPFGTIRGIKQSYLKPHYLQQSRLVHKVNGHWVVGPPPPEHADAGVAAAAPQPRGRRARAPRGPPVPAAAPEVPPPPPHPPVDQLTAFFGRMDARFDTIEHRIDVDQQWQAGMFLGMYEQQGLHPPAGYEYPYTYRPNPPFYCPPGPPQ